MAKLDRRRNGIYGQPVGKRAVIFVDDLNKPEVEFYGAQPPIELIRTWCDQGFFYDLKDMSKFGLQDVQLLAAMGPPGGGRNDITTRMSRHLNVITIHEFSAVTMSAIFSTIVEIHAGRGGYDGSYLQLGKKAVAATLSVFNAAIENFLPTPSKSHYLFNLRDFARVMFGCLQLPASHLEGNDKFVRLWVHESYRVFADRLIEASDAQMFFDMVEEACKDCFKTPMDKVMGHLVSGKGQGSANIGHILDIFVRCVLSVC